ncbi:MAG: hypothetical protein R3B09_24960 [Nannocystaceae bacterium]
MSRARGLATLSVLMLGCPMPNPAWVESASSSDTAPDSESGSGTSSATSTSTGTTGTTTTTTGSTTTSTTEPTTSTGTTTSTTSSTTQSTTTDVTTDPTDSSSSTTGEPTCDDVLADALEANALDLTLDLAPDGWALDVEAMCGGVFIWTGGALYNEKGNNRHGVDLVGGCGDLGKVTISGNFPPGLEPNLNGGDCIRLLAYLRWDPEAKSCTHVMGFEIEVKDNSDLLFAVGSGIEKLSAKAEVKAESMTGCPAKSQCDGTPGIDTLTSVNLGVMAVEGEMKSANGWDFYDLRSHTHDMVGGMNDALCLQHVDWIMNHP